MTNDSTGNGGKQSGSSCSACKELKVECSYVETAQVSTHIPRYSPLFTFSGIQKRAPSKA